MNIKEKVNLKEIIFTFYQKDITKLLSTPNYNIRLEDKEKLLLAVQSNLIQDLFETIKAILEKNLEADQFDLSIMLTLFLQRYNYFYLTEQEWIRFVNQIEVINADEKSESDLESVMMFFENQIDLYNNNYLDLLEKYELRDWNSKFYEDLKGLASNIYSETNFTKKLEAVEKMIIFLQNTKNIYVALEGVGIEERKREFLAHSNELKIVFQSMNNLIKAILQKIV